MPAFDAFEEEWLVLANDWPVQRSTPAITYLSWLTIKRYMIGCAAKSLFEYTSAFSHLLRHEDSL